MSAEEPLRVREGARFTCHGDGLCCTNVHSFGPLTEDEIALLDNISEGLVMIREGDPVIVEKENGGCVFLGAGGCELHARLGPSVKPEACRQFPYRLVATPTGTRVATEHRCPCRTMGDRAPVDAEDARAACSLDKPDRVVTFALPIDEGEVVDLPTWEAIEPEVLAAIASGEGLGVAPFSSGDWEGFVNELGDLDESNRFAEALLCFRAAVLSEPLPALSWSEAFDRAEARSEEGDPEAMLADWLADEVWSLEWAFRATWRQAKIDLSTRAAVARRIAAQLPGRPDRAMAEAIAVVELAALADEHLAFLQTL